jgi:PAS domain S-box-containing protein
VNKIIQKTGSERAAVLFQEAENTVHKRADRLFAKLMVVQWLAGIVAALWISPKTWIGPTSQAHWHVWAAIFLGGAITSLPVFLALKQPGRVLTRHTIAVAQMFFSALLIHLTGGRIETHFHVFGSLAFLAFYRDWRVLVSGTVVVVLDHFLRGVFWPQSIFGVLAASPWRWVEHAGWVLFEDTFLIISIRQSLIDMRGLAERQASLEVINAGIEYKIIERTAELTKEIAERKKTEAELNHERDLLRALMDNAPDQIYFKDTQSRFLQCSKAMMEKFGVKNVKELLGKSDADFFGEEHARLAFEDEQEIIRTGQPVIGKVEREGWKNNQETWALTSKMPLRNKAGEIIGTFGISKDITAIKEAETKLNSVHKELMDASRQAGMAEVATSVLHNVGNVLNSVNVSSSLIAEKMRSSKIANINKAVTLIRTHENDLNNFFANDPKGKQLPAYLSNLASHLAQEQEDILHEVGSLVSNIMHIKEIVAMQQNYAKTSGVLESLKIVDLVEDAICMNNGAMTRHLVKVVRDFAEIPPILTEKHKVLQILVNLIRNAKYACDDSGRNDKQITMRVANGNNRIKISVIDNGIGIPAENLTRIFSHGFTTRKEGHGFGLHSGALAAKEMGGTLAAFSEGPGQGATFTLELPIQKQR